MVTGTSPPLEDPVNAARLEAWLADNVKEASGPVSVTRLSGGSSNLSFRVRDDANDWVLRRPPLVHVLATANDMKREHTVQAALRDTDVPVARTVAYCEDASVIGGPFYLMQMLDGIVFNTAQDVGHLSAHEALAASYELMDVLARLHSVDYAAVGLGSFGKPAGFLGRQVNRWIAQWENSKQRELPAIDEVARRLLANLPPEGGDSIVHGDYSFNNTMFRKDEPGRMLAVLDWEMSTLGDPLADVGMVAVYWGDVGEILWRNRDAPQPHRANRGFPTVDVLLDRYATMSGRDLSHIAFYRALAIYKLACITEGSLARRVKARQTDLIERTRSMVTDLAGMALSAADRLKP